MAGTVRVADDGPVLRATVPLDGRTPAQAITAFTDPELLARWWGGQLTAELWPGGRYSVWFAKIPARMTGQVVSYTPGSELVFSWGWEHEPEAPARTVTVRAGVADGAPTSAGSAGGVVTGAGSVVTGAGSAGGVVTGAGTGGSVLTVEHGPYGDSEAELAARAEHREGWEFFLPRLVSEMAG